MVLRPSDKAKGSARRSSRFDAFVIYAMGNGPLAKPSAVRAAAVSRALQALTPSRLDLKESSTGARLARLPAVLLGRCCAAARVQ